MSQFGLFIRNCVIGLLCGVIFGLKFPALIPFWLLLLGLVCVIMFFHFLGSLRFGNRWRLHRLSYHYITSGVAIAAWLGIMFGNKSVGKMLTFLGELLS